MCITNDDYQVIYGCISGLRESCEGHGGLVGREQNIIYTVNVVFWKHLQLPIHYHDLSTSAQ